MIARLLDGPAQILATGGGAFMDPATRSLIRERAISRLAARRSRHCCSRVSRRRNNRPLLKNGDPRAVLSRLIDERYPIYAEADITVDTRRRPARSDAGQA